MQVPVFKGLPVPVQLSLTVDSSNYVWSNKNMDPKKYVTTKPTNTSIEVTNDNAHEWQFRLLTKTHLVTW